MVDSLKPVDYVFINTLPKNPDPLYTIKFTFENLKPDIYVINDDAFDIEHRKKLCEEMNVELVILPRYCPEEFDNISTSKIIQKIKELD